MCPPRLQCLPPPYRRRLLCLRSHRPRHSLLSPLPSASLSLLVPFLPLPLHPTPRPRHLSRSSCTTIHSSSTRKSSRILRLRICAISKRSVHRRHLRSCRATSCATTRRSSRLRVVGVEDAVAHDEHEEQGQVAREDRTRHKVHSRMRHFRLECRRHQRLRREAPTPPHQALVVRAMLRRRRLLPWRLCNPRSSRRLLLLS